MYIKFSLPDFCECHKRPKRPTFTIIPERDAVVVLGKIRVLKTVLAAAVTQSVRAFAEGEVFEFHPRQTLVVKTGTVPETF